MNLDNLKNNVCTLSTRNLDPSLNTADIRVAFTSDNKGKLDDYVRSAIGFKLPSVPLCEQCCKHVWHRGSH